MTISHTAPPLEDNRITLARMVLAELPPAEDISLPYQWIGRLRVTLQQLLEVTAPAPAGLSGEQREALALALADAADYREGRASDSHCADCDQVIPSLCSDHLADQQLAEAYVQLADELGIHLEGW